MIGSAASIASASLALPATLTEMLRRRAAAQADRIAYTFLADGATDARSITWSALNRRAAAIGARLRESGACGQRVLLALPSGLAFIESLFGCWYAGATAVPVSLPRHQRVKHRLGAIVADATARFAIATGEVRQMLCGDAPQNGPYAALIWIAPDVAEDDGAANVESDGDATPAVIQYTSGSTGTPHGVVVTHSNLLNNSAQISAACGHGPDSAIGGWLPLFHDMGLVGLVVQAAVCGARCVLMPPERFLMRPWLWLGMISDYRICSSPAPNFAYDLCVDRIGIEHKARLDLSCWRNALNGSEPVRSATLERFAEAFAACGFRREAFFPCYGLAESTLFVTGPGARRHLARRTAGGTLLPQDKPGGHIGCGRTYGDTRLAIVDPQTARALPEGAIGEIWICGASCAAGYWNNPQATAATFNGRLATERCKFNSEIPLPIADCRLPIGESVESGLQSAFVDRQSAIAKTRSSSCTPPAHAEEAREEARSWLRTGDLGFIADGDLFITGRLRELIIIAGRNHFPIDLERTVEAAEPAVVAPSGVAAFAVAPEGIERLVVAAEVRREHGRAARGGASLAIDPDLVRRRIRAAVAAEHDVMPHDLVLLQSGALPRTTSGKISRDATRRAYLHGTLKRFEGASHASTNV